MMGTEWLEEWLALSLTGLCSQKGRTAGGGRLLFTIITHDLSILLLLSSLLQLQLLLSLLLLLLLHITFTITIISNIQPDNPTDPKGLLRSYLS